mmetsp:Transcript_22074/g.32894  ORF Transcript_22074/g.32894 Transcript_22074/m.32894 type:complete len:394 (+) Transcript_22074:65-1246(+)|eukprot:CAMPEP_0167743576 /NCGR_PEP_ID=MMETSP0110_2-20121227/2091_1 /TAXON_ID=629695 /ORGANISM="Gymnochlora sp., Strain CCMP2014" /LENGTH=393 /DNA_ID=CAMNT_0007627959 /DNA_START=22 /DNA_END=1203 /DNA_ORIENTATION=+
MAPLDVLVLFLATTAFSHVRSLIPKPRFMMRRPLSLGLLPRRITSLSALQEEPNLIPVHSEEDEEDLDDDSVYEDVISQRKHLHVRDNFLPSQLAADLRGTFDERFADPRAAHPERFAWDYWHIPEQYTLVRTPASEYFPKDMFSKLEESLTTYAQEVLGCRSISPMWLSYYVDGCFQELHADVPHGPWAFVLSLTDWENREFKGGETKLMWPHMVEMWRDFDDDQGLELQDIMQHIPAEFNRLTIFDPRLPHGVRRVSGTQDPRKGRLVLHGWFTEPSPFFIGALTEEQASPVLQEGMEGMIEELSLLPPATGTLCVKIQVSPSGAVEALDWLSDTVVPRPGAKVPALDGQCVEPPEDARFLILEAIWKSFAAIEFPEASGSTNITVPLIFR